METHHLYNIWKKHTLHMYVEWNLSDIVGAVRVGLEATTTKLKKNIHDSKNGSNFEYGCEFNLGPASKA